MDQLVKFISESISDMTSKPFDNSSTPSSSSSFTNSKIVERKLQPDFLTEDSWIKIISNNESNDGKLEDFDLDVFRNYNCTEVDDDNNNNNNNNNNNEDMNNTWQPYRPTPPSYPDSCKFHEGNDMSQDVVQQSQVSSSKSPSVLANDIIGPLLLEALDGFLFMVDKRNEIQFISENVTQYLKYTKEDLIGNSIFNLIHMEDHEFFSQALDILMFDPSCKSPCFSCRMLIKQPGKSQPAYDRMQITTTIQSYPLESKPNPANQLIACVARRIGVSKPNILSTEIEQFTTKQDVKGVILDTCGLNPDNFGPLNLIGQNIQNFCHVNDKPQLFKHHREVLSSGTNTSGVYRFKLKEEKYVFVQTKSQLFKNHANPKLDFVMSTHSIVKECCDDNELKGTASSSLVKAIIGQAGNKQKMRHQTTDECLGDYPSFYSQQDNNTGEGDAQVKVMQTQYWRGGKGIDLPLKPRGRGERLTTRPVGRPRLHPGGFASSRLHAQMSRSSDIKSEVLREGCSTSIYLVHHQRRRRRQHHLPRSNSMTIDSDMYSNKRLGPSINVGSTENVCFNPQNRFGGSFVPQERNTLKDFRKEIPSDNFLEIIDTNDFLPSTEQSFLDDLLAEAPELESSLCDDWMELNASIVGETGNQTNHFSQSKSTFAPQENFIKSSSVLPTQNFNESTRFDPSVNNLHASNVAFKQADFRGTLAEDHTHLGDLLVDGKTDRRKDKASTSNSNVILKKLLSQDDEENVNEEDSHEGGGRVLALLTQGTAIGEIFPGGICKQLKKELENNSNLSGRDIFNIIEVSRSENNTSLSIVSENSKIFCQDNSSNLSAMTTHRFISEVLNNDINKYNIPDSLCKERQNILLKELLNEKSNQSTPSVQSKLLKSLLASDEANFDVLEEKCNSENKIALLSIVEKNCEDQILQDNQTSNDLNNSAKNDNNDNNNINNSNNNNNNNNNNNDSTNDDFADNFSLDFDIEEGKGEDPSYVNVTFDSNDPVTATSLSGPYCCNNSKDESNMADIYSQKSFFHDPLDVTKKLFSHSCSPLVNSPILDAHQICSNSGFLSTSDSSFSYNFDHSDKKKLIAGSRSSQKNVLLAQLLSRTSDDNFVTNVSTASPNLLTNVSMASTTTSTMPSSIFSTRNASSIAVVTPMVHLLKQNKNCSSPLATVGKESKDEELNDSKEKTDFMSRKVKPGNPMGGQLAKPSASLQPFRCHPITNQQRQACLSSQSLSSSVLSLNPTFMDVSTPKARFYYSGGTMEQGNKFEPRDSGLVGVLRFESSGISTELTQYSTEIFVKKDCDLMFQQSIKTQDSKIIDSNCIPEVIDSISQNSMKYSLTTTSQSTDSIVLTTHYENESNFKKAGYDSLKFGSNKQEGLVLVKNIQTSTNVCSTKPFISTLSSSPSSSMLIKDKEDPFSVTYSPISPALQEENSQHDCQMFSSNFNLNSTNSGGHNICNNISDIICNYGSITDNKDIDNSDIAGSLDRRVNDNLNCISQMTTNIERDITQRTDDSLNATFQSNLFNSTTEWTNSPNVKNQFQFMKHDIKISNMDQVLNERISRKRIHSDAFMDQHVVESQWTVSDQTNRPPFDASNQHQPLYSKHQMLVDQKRHSGMYPDISSYQDMMYARSQTIPHMHQNVDVIPSYHVERGWNQGRWAHQVSGSRHKPNHMSGDYLGHQERFCYSAINEKIMKQPYFFQPSHSFINHQRPCNPSFPTQYKKYKTGMNDFMSCCNVPNCIGDNTGRSHPHEFNNHPKHLQQQFHNQQLHLAQKQFQFPQQHGFQTEGQRHYHHDNGPRPQYYPHNVHQLHPVQHQQLISDVEVDQPLQNHHLHSNQKLSSLTVDDSLRIHPDSGLLDFPAEENQMLSDRREGRTSKAQQPCPSHQGSNSYKINEGIWDVGIKSVSSCNQNLQFSNTSLTATKTSNDDKPHTTKECLHKEITNICTARSQQNKTIDVANDNNFLIQNQNMQDDQQNVGIYGNKLSQNHFVESMTQHIVKERLDADKSRRTNQTTQGRSIIAEPEDTFKSISFTDVESDTFWLDMSTGNEDKI